MLLSMKTVLLSVPAMPKELWHLSETLSSVFSDGYNVPPSLKPSELLPTNLLSFSDSFVFDTPKLFFSCLISCIPPKPRRFPCQNPPFLCHFSSFSPVCPFLSPSALPAYSSRSYYAPRFLDFDVTLSSWVIAFRAPRTLNRCLPDGALRNNRVKHQRYPKKRANTKCAASIKNTALFPSSASLRRGSSVFFKVFLLINISFGGNCAYFAMA